MLKKMVQQSKFAFVPEWATSISAKIFSIVLLAALGIGALTYQAGVTSQKDLLNDKETELSHIIEAAVNIAQSLYRESQDGKITEAEAQERAKQAIRQMRFDGGNYIFISGLDQRAVMHPMDPTLTGKDISGMKDPNGVYTIREMTKIAKSKGEGALHYVWAKPGKSEPTPKLAYVKLFGPWQWILGTGAYIDDIEETYHAHLLELAAISLTIFAIIMALSLVLAFSITRPIKSIVDSMLKLASGDNEMEITHSDRGDEIGNMSRALLIFRDNAKKRIALEAEQAEQKKVAEAQQRQMLLEMANRFDQSVRDIMQQVNDAALGVGEQTQLLAERSQENSVRIDAISEAMTESSVSVETVAGASEEMTASISEIASQVDESSRFSQTAVDEVQKANQVIGSLSESSKAIGQIVGLIQDIAEQTNLLALNATIEAARAGEAGKGFAVVASEVKELASQTGKATEEIADQINTIQTTISDAVQAIGHVDNTIGQLSSISNAIAAAVEEQGVASGEISASISSAALSSRGVSDNTEALSGLAQKNDDAAKKMAQNVVDLDQQIQSLMQQIDDFVGTVRQQNDEAPQRAA